MIVRINCGKVASRIAIKKLSSDGQINVGRLGSKPTETRSSGIQSHIPITIMKSALSDFSGVRCSAISPMSNNPTSIHCHSRREWVITMRLITRLSFRPCMIEFGMNRRIRVITSLRLNTNKTHPITTVVATIASAESIPAIPIAATAFMGWTGIGRRYNPPVTRANMPKPNSTPTGSIWVTIKTPNTNGRKVPRSAKLADSSPTCFKLDDWRRNTDSRG